MTTEKVDLAVIGVFSLVGLPYTIKYLWSPLMDRFVPPFLGRRRGWMLVTQAALFAAVVAMAFAQPKAHPGVLAFLALLVAFCSASQDIVVDAYRTEILLPEELGPGAGVHILGYRVAMLTSGAIALILADRLPWRVVYLLMAGSLVVGMAASLLSPEPELPPKSPRNLREAVVEPFLEFFGRPGAVGILLFIVFYKLDVVMATALTTPFLLELGFTKTDIGAVTKGLGMISTIVGDPGGRRRRGQGRDEGVPVDLRHPPVRVHPDVLRPGEARPPLPDDGGGDRHRRTCAAAWGRRRTRRS